MQKNSIIYQRVRSYLLGLGYSDLELFSDVNLNQKQDLDFVIYDKNKPFIIAEIKNNLEFAKKNNTELKYNPFVRQLQSYARDIGATYYLLTDGEDNLWFKTDNFGRPQLLQEPIFAITNSQNYNFDSETLIKVFNELKKILLNSGTVVDMNYEASVLILVQLFDKDRRSYLKQLLINEDNIRFNNEIANLLRIEIQKQFLYSREVIEESFRLLENISFAKVKPLELLSAIDEVFFSNSKGKEYKISKWLADFLVKLSKIGSNAKVLDLNNRFGEITTAVTMASSEFPPIEVYGLNQNLEGAIWSKIQQLILGNRSENIIFDNNINEDLVQRYHIPMPTNIITALTFGTRGNRRSFNNDYNLCHNKFEDYLLELAVKWTEYNGLIVALVPESFLFEGGNRRKFRNRLLEEVSLRAVISLPSGALLPSSSVKSSIIVLNKVRPNNADLIFMADIKDIASNDIYSCDKISDIIDVLNEYDKYLFGNSSPFRSKRFSIITRSELDETNLTVQNYLEINNRLHEVMQYPIFKLCDITNELKRGRASKINENGKILLLGPAAIRPLEIVKSNIGRTTIDQLGSRPVEIRYGDIIINNIGTYLGAASMIEEKIENTFISQHVVLIRANESFILPDYLAVALNSDFVKEQIYRKANGSVMPSISMENLRKLEIPVPDIEEQKYIVRQIYESRNKILEIKGLLNENIARFERMLSSMLLEGRDNI